MSRGAGADARVFGSFAALSAVATIDAYNDISIAPRGSCG
jgi:hypothetical protein